jgi:hypothetical protein
MHENMHNPGLCMEIGIMEKLGIWLPLLLSRLCPGMRNCWLLSGATKT